MVLSIEYAAGIIDGEGYFSLTKQRPKQNYVQPIIGVSLVRSPESEALLQGFKETFGGHIYIKPKETWLKRGINAQDQICWKVSSYHDSQKKQPLKLQIPFSWRCNERRLI
jgi:hypothetical protein